MRLNYLTLIDGITLAYYVNSQNYHENKPFSDINRDYILAFLDSL